MGGKVCLRYKGKTLLGVVNKLFVLPLHLKQIFLSIIWIFTKGEGDGIESRLPFKIFSTLIKNSMTNNVTNFLDNGYFRFKKHEISILKVNLLDQKCVLRLIFFLNIKIEQNLLSLTWRVLPNNEKLHLVKMDLNFVSSAVISVGMITKNISSSQKQCE